eukprot:gene36546-44334_t
MASVTSFQQFCYNLARVSKIKTTTLRRPVVNGLVDFVRPFIGSQVSQNNIMEKGWFNAEKQLRAFLAKYNTSNRKLTGNMRDKIKAILAMALAQFYKKTYAGWIEANKTQDADVLIARFHGARCFAGITDGDWLELLAIYDELRLLKFILSKPNKCVMETAAVMLAVDEFVCVVGGKASQFVLRVHHVYALVTGTVIRGRTVDEKRQSSYRLKYQEFLRDVRCDAPAKDAGEDVSASAGGKRKRKARSAAEGALPTMDKRQRVAAAPEAENSVFAAPLVMPVDQRVLELALSEQDDDDGFSEDLGFDWEEQEVPFNALPAVEAAMSLSFWPLALSGELTKKLQPLLLRPGLDLSLHGFAFVQ